MFDRKATEMALKLVRKLRYNVDMTMAINTRHLSFILPKYTALLRTLLRVFCLFLSGYRLEMDGYLIWLCKYVKIYVRCRPYELPFRYLRTYCVLHM